MVEIAIVGAGPAGAALSVLLARRGAHVRLVERETSSERVFRGEGLMPLGLDALEQMRLDWSIDDLPGRVVGAWRIIIDGDEVLTIPEPAAELGRRAFRVTSPSALIDRLVADAERLPRFTFSPGTRVVDLVRDGRSRVVGVRARQDDRDVEWPVDLVVAADGRGSLVRTKSRLQLDLDPQQYDVLWFKVPPPASLRGRSDFLITVRAGHHPLIAYTSWDDRLQCGVIMPKGGLAQIRDDDWLVTAVGAAPRWLADHILEAGSQVIGPVRLNVLVGHATSWWTPGVLLVGDAAHPMSPVRAQGINLALRDAVVAANHLVPLADGHPDPGDVDRACAAIESERRPEIRRAQMLQRREARGQGDARSGSWQYAVAKHGARLLGRYRWAQRAWLQRQHDLRFGSTDVQLRDQEAPAG